MKGANMKIDVPVDIGDKVFAVRITKCTGFSKVWVDCSAVKEIGKDKSGLFINVGGTRSRLEALGKKIFTDKTKADKEADRIAQSSSNYTRVNKVNYF